MPDNYDRLIQNNLQQLYAADIAERARALPAEQRGPALVFGAFGRTCRIDADGIRLDSRPIGGPLGVVISLYALHAAADVEIIEPLKSFKDFPNSMPYAAAFKTHCEHILVSRVAEIESQRAAIIDGLQGTDGGGAVGGDFAFRVKPLPKISLLYGFYRPDEDFPASVSCLFSNNADRFLPVDGLADLGEYTSKTILEWIEQP